MTGDVRASSRRFARGLVAVSCVRPEALNVAPDLVGVPLAPHAGRAGAMLVDLAVIALLSSTGSFWLAAAAAALVFQWRRRQHERSLWRNAWLGIAIAALAFLAVQRGVESARRWLDPQAVAAARQADEAQPGADIDADADADSDAIDHAREVLGDSATAALLRPAAAASTASGALPAGAALAPAATAREAQLARRVQQLEDDLAESRKSRPARWRDRIVRAAQRFGLGFGWAIAYFTLLPFWWRGQTVGKKLFGLRVVHLTGAPLSVVTCFGRYGGYAAGMATGASGFAQVLWDSNRQAIQDKIAHTVVVDVRGARALAPPASPDAAPDAANPAARKDLA